MEMMLWMLLVMLPARACSEDEESIDGWMDSDHDQWPLLYDIYSTAALLQLLCMYSILVMMHGDDIDE